MKSVYLPNIGFGVDTIKASLAIPSRELALYSDCFDVKSQHETKTGVIERWIIKPTDENASPRVTYYPRDYRLIVEVSLPKLLHNSNVAGVSGNFLEVAFFALDDYLNTLSPQALPPIQDWPVRRVDYVTGWYVDENMLFYIIELAKRDLGRYEKTLFRSGVRWQTKSRRINIYDKFAQDGTGKGLLRCEIQNKWPAIAWMSRKWFGIAPTVGNFASAELAQQVMTRFLEQLRVEELPAVPDDVRLKKCFGSRWAQAKTYRELIAEHGVDAYKSGLMSRASYYRYKSELIQHNLLSNSEYSLEGLGLNGHL